MPGILNTLGGTKAAETLTKILLASKRYGKDGELLDNRALLASVNSMFSKYCHGVKLIQIQINTDRLWLGILSVWRDKFAARARELLTDDQGYSYLHNLITAKYRDALRTRKNTLFWRELDNKNNFQAKKNKRKP